MVKSALPQAPAVRPSKAEVVRAEKPIPAMERSSPKPDLPGPTPSQCTGRCGHCHLDPCQLHAPV